MRRQIIDRVEDLPRSLDRASGVYVIRSHQTGKVLYVGESHTDQLRKTLFRHFNKWPTDYFHRRPRPVYDRNRVSVEITTTAPGDAVEFQNKLICELQPRDNLAMPGCGEDEGDPF